MRTALLCAITQWVVVIPYWHFGTTYLPLKLDYHYSLHNNSEEHSSHSLHSRSWNHTYVEAPLELLCLLHVSQHLNDFLSFISSSVGDSTWHHIGWYFSQHIVPPVRIIFLRHLKYIAGFKCVARVRRVVWSPWAAESQGKQNEYCKWKLLIFNQKKKS
jgi:hypothetical protein